MVDEMCCGAYGLFTTTRSFVELLLLFYKKRIGSELELVM